MKSLTKSEITLEILKSFVYLEDFEISYASSPSGKPLGQTPRIAVYVAELRKIAEHCEYGEVLSDMLRDRLVCGTNNKGIQRRLLLQTELTFDKAMEVALPEKPRKRIRCASRAGLLIRIGPRPL